MLVEALAVASWAADSLGHDGRAVWRLLRALDDSE